MIKWSLKLKHKIVKSQKINMSHHINRLWKKNHIPIMTNPENVYNLKN